eukprot:scaffold4993_cov211-Prasinococcus_capsulatus_cf.AAC.6
MPSPPALSRRAVRAPPNLPPESGFGAKTLSVPKLCPRFHGERSAPRQTARQNLCPSLHTTLPRPLGKEARAQAGKALCDIRASDGTGRRSRGEARACALFPSPPPIATRLPAPASTAVFPAPPRKAVADSPVDRLEREPKQQQRD